MEKESSISLGGSIILFAIFAHNYIIKQRYTSLYKKDIKEAQNKPMETTQLGSSNNLFF